MLGDIMVEFKVMLRKEDSWFVVTVPALPGCISQGKSEKEALENIREAIELHVNSLAKEGVPLVLPKEFKEVLVSVSSKSEAFRESEEAVLLRD